MEWKMIRATMTVVMRNKYLYCQVPKKTTRKSFISYLSRIVLIKIIVTIFLPLLSKPILSVK